MWCYNSERFERIGRPKPCWLFVCYDRPIRYVELVWNRGHYVLRAQRTARKEEDKTSFSLRHNAESFVVSSVRLVGTTWENCQRFITNVFLKASSGRRGLERFHDWTWGCRDCCFFRGHSSQRVAWEEKYQVPSSSLWGVVFARPYLRLFLSSSVSVFVCPCLRLSLFSSISVFVYLRLRLSLSQCQVFVQRASAVDPMFYIEGLKTTVACVF